MRHIELQEWTDLPGRALCAHPGGREGTRCGAIGSPRFPPLRGTIDLVWDARIEPCDGGRRFEIFHENAPLTFREYLRALEEDPAFSDWYTALLVESGQSAFFWEHPPLSTASLDDPAEFVLVSGPSLAAIRADPEPFRAPLARFPRSDVASFENLGGDALLVVPRAVAPPEGYAHLSAFLRSAPASQIAELWRHTGRVVREKVCARSKWLSTAGTGVAWVHIRLDDRPKYYRFGPYMRENVR